MTEVIESLLVYGNFLQLGFLKILHNKVSKLAKIRVKLRVQFTVDFQIEYFVEF